MQSIGVAVINALVIMVMTVGCGYMGIRHCTEYGMKSKVVVGTSYVLALMGVTMMIFGNKSYFVPLCAYLIGTLIGYGCAKLNERHSVVHPITKG